MHAGRLPFLATYSFKEGITRARHFEVEFNEIENKPFFFSNGNSYLIEKAIQTIQFELDKTGGKIKSEAGMMLAKTALPMVEEKREFIIDNTFAIFLKEEGKDNPYFAGKISDITKFQ